MRTNLFLESAAEHAQRIGLPKDRTRMLRQVLTLKREGYPPESVFVQMGADNVTWSVATSTLDELELELDVIWEDNGYIPGHLTAPAMPSQVDADTEQPQAHVGKKRLLAHYGLYQGKQPPYGYLFDCEVRIKTTDGRVVTGHSLIPDPETAKAVQHIFAELANGTALATIAASLNICAVVSPAGAAWDAEQVRAIVHCAPLYAGFIVYRDKKHEPARGPETLYPGHYAPLIELATFLAVIGGTLEWPFGPTREAQAAAPEEWA